jgi:hypothetical protein
MTPSPPYRPRACDLPSMIATLNSYEAIFGPYHLQTLMLTVQVARTLWVEGEIQDAQKLLEYSTKHLARCGEHAHAVRVSTLTALRDLLLERPDFEKAIAVQREIVVCRTQLTGPEDPEVIGEKARLTSLLISTEAHATSA